MKYLTRITFPCLHDMAYDFVKTCRGWHIANVVVFDNRICLEKIDEGFFLQVNIYNFCLLYTSDAADE